MKLFFLLFVLATNSSIVFGQYVPSPLDTQTVNLSSFIAVVKIEEENDGRIFFKLESIFKWKKCLGLRSEISFHVAKVYDNLTFVTGESYLLFCLTNENCELTLDKYSRVLSIKDSGKDINFLNSYLPCQDRDMERQYPCHRNLRPVCGCDGVTYGNECEAIRKGIQKFKDGRCEEK